MNPLRPRLILSLLCVLLGTLLAVPVSHAAQKRPNVVLIVADDLGWRDLSVQGSSFYETPNVDSLAANGIRFSRGYATCQVCSPSRASLLTGRFPARLGITEWIGQKAGADWKRATKLLPAVYRRDLPKERVTIAEAMKEGGYTTFFAGKWHLGDHERDWPEYHGFDINKGGYASGGPKGGYFSRYNNPRLVDGPVGEYLPFRLGRETAGFIDANADVPFYAQLCFYSVHAPAQTTEALWKKYRDKAADLPEPAERFAMERRRPIRQVQDNPVYGGMIEAMDTAVGMVLDALDRNGLRQNTIVIFTSDNGGVSSGDHWATSNLPLRGGKGYQWEGGLRVPFIVSWPEHLQTRVEESSRVTGTDIYPTVLDLVGLPLRPAEHLDGVSLVSALQGEELAERPLYWHYPHYSNQGGDPCSVLISGDWKLIHYPEDGSVELYQLSDDPAETTNVAGSQPERAKQMRRQLLEWVDSVDAPLATANPNYVEDEFQEELEKQRTRGRAHQEEFAKDILDPEWVPKDGWWEARGSFRK